MIYLHILIVKYGNIVMYMYDVVQQVSRTYSSCISEILYPLISNSPVPLATTILFLALKSLAILILHISGIM